MELNTLQLTGASGMKISGYQSDTSGLSSPVQLVNSAGAVTVTLDQTAAGTEFMVYDFQQENHATKLAWIRNNSFDRLGSAWRALADL